MKFQTKILLMFLLGAALSCRTKENNPVSPPVVNQNNNNVVPQKKVVYLDDVTMSNIRPVSDQDTGKTCFNFKECNFTKWKKDSFDLCYHVYKITGSDTLYYNLAGPSHSTLRLNNAGIGFTDRNTSFYLPKTELSFYKSMYDTILYDVTLPRMIAERFAKVYVPQTGEAAAVTSKGAPFYTGQIIGFKTSRGKYGILRILSDGRSAGVTFVKFEVKYQK